MFCLVYIYCLLFSFYSVCWCSGVVIFWGVFYFRFLFFRVVYILGGCFISDFVLYILYSFFDGVFVFMCFFGFFRAFYLFFWAVYFGLVFLTLILSFFLFCQTFLDFLAINFLSFISS